MAAWSTIVCLIAEYPVTTTCECLVVLKNSLYSANLKIHELVVCSAVLRSSGRNLGLSILVHNSFVGRCLSFEEIPVPDWSRRKQSEQLKHSFVQIRLCNKDTTKNLPDTTSPARFPVGALQNTHRVRTFRLSQKATRYLIGWSSIIGVKHIRHSNSLFFVNSGWLPRPSTLSSTAAVPRSVRLLSANYSTAVGSVSC